MTLLFADVVHSMDIAAAVGAERLREVMAELVNRASDVVERYGGTVDKFTGDGIMAVFGAPVALEDHALRAGLVALGIQDVATALAEDVARRDHVALQLRIGLNSGQVIAGEIGSRSMSYTAIGEQVGMAQRMESVAPPGGVMVSESTARLIEHVAVMDEPQLVHIKGSDTPVRARRLHRIEPRHDSVGRDESTLVGRHWEMGAVDAMLQRAIQGRGGVVGLVGPPGIGKSRFVREVAMNAADHGADVCWTFCESHERDIAFQAIARLLRDALGVVDLDDSDARAQVRFRFPGADEQDLVLLDDLLGIADATTPLPSVDPDARRRRLTSLINGASLARTRPAVYVIEDAHWIDDVSESLLADFLTVIPQTASLVLITYRTEYRGRLANVAGAQTIALAPLDDSETSTLLDELIGTDASAHSLAATIHARAGGNPFFAQEMVRDLVERGVLRGTSGALVCQPDAVEVSVPPTLQATIAARIDRLNPRAKRVLCGAAVLGLRFGTDLFAAMDIDPDFGDLLSAQLIDQVMFTPRSEYAFHHPMIRAVAYEAQLKADRAELHRRLAAGIEAREPDSTDERAAVIAEHLEAAGDFRQAYAWHMRAGTWATNRDIAAARISWERARYIADALPEDEADRIAMRIAPRTMLCGTAWRVGARIDGSFDDLRALCELAGDKLSLAIGMTGMAAEHMFYGRIREAARVSSEQIAIIDSIGDPTLIVALAFATFVNKFYVGDMDEILRLSTAVIDAADGDPAKGDLLAGSPLAVAFVWRGVAKWWTGRPGWRHDLDEGVAMARDPLILAAATSQKYGLAIANGVLLADDDAVRALEDAVRGAERLGDDRAYGLVKYALALALLERDDAADRQRGRRMMTEMHDMCIEERFYRSELAGIEGFLARELARDGQPERAILILRKAANDMSLSGQVTYFVGFARFLVDVLLERGTEADVAEAEDVVEQLANLPHQTDSAMRDITLVRSRALLARAHGEKAGYRDLVSRYRAMAESLGFEGHLAWATAMDAGPDEAPSVR